MRILEIGGGTGANFKYYEVPAVLDVVGRLITVLLAYCIIRVCLYVCISTHVSVLDSLGNNPPTKSQILICFRKFVIFLAAVCVCGCVAIVS